ncbi:hypothetical protein [Bacillus bingmayongensis]|uniref:hypothetical protein n=1 Tax=Bacillus bingmayongensis TaxID=1150157 RepID=UPI001C8EFDD6|nr:hypothetical protein [Bacillus bingmayongensis]MBY0596942.1 hypothetical protein [Bacillus bingmayongensis]
MKWMEANEQEFQGMKVKPSNYLIERIAENQYFIHREITEQEREAFREEKLFPYKGKWYLPLVSCPSEEQAVTTVHSYWQGIKELNSII